MPSKRGRASSALFPDYYTWLESNGKVHGRRVRFAWKPGLSGAGDVDPAAVLLVEQLPVDPQEHVLVMQAGSGLAAAAVAGAPGVGRLDAMDPHIVAVEATRRSLGLNDISAPAKVSATADARNVAAEGSVDTVLVRLPKSKPRVLLAIWSAYQVLKPGGRLFLAGAKQEGIKSHLRHVKDLFGNLAGLAYRKGHRVAQAVKPMAAGSLPPLFQASWLAPGHFHQFAVEVAGRQLQLKTRPGVFAWERLDPGSRSLIEAMRIEQGDDILDLGCGCGIAGLVSAKEGAASVTMADADNDAVTAAKRNAADSGLQHVDVFHSDCAQAVLDRRFDVVVTNPPFHQGRAIDYATSFQFVRDASSVLRPGGRLYLVANRFIAYEDEMQRHFDVVETAFQDSHYKVLLGRK